MAPSRAPVRAVPGEGSPLTSLGQRVRARRRTLGLTLRQLSERTGTSVPFLSQVENGVGTPSLTTLFTLARELGTAPEVLLAGSVHDEVTLVRNGEGQRFTVSDAPSSAVRRQITGAEETFSAAEYTINPGDDLGGFFSSQGREVLHVLAGRIAVDLVEPDGIVTHELATGDTLVYSTSTEHRWRHLGRATTRFLHVITP
jgi:transcriptional regulator with XRE-family HTH domain